MIYNLFIPRDRGWGTIIWYKNTKPCPWMIYVISQLVQYTQGNFSTNSTLCVFTNILLGYNFILQRPGQWVLVVTSKQYCTSLRYSYCLQVWKNNISSWILRDHVLCRLHCLLRFSEILSLLENRLPGSCKSV